MASGDQQDDKGGKGGGGEEQEERTDGWMATYADMVTLLMTFFVLLFAISNIDAQKFALVAAALSRGGLTPEIFYEIEVTYGGDMDDYENPRVPSEELSEAASDPGNLGNPELDALAKMFGEYIEDNGLGDRISLAYDGEWLLLTLADDLLFRPGSAEVSQEMLENSAFIAQMLADTHNDDRPFEIVIAGHTDNTPINTARYPSNWDLSLDRAANFMRAVMLSSDLYPGYFSARGFGEEKPIADNETAEGRQANRRVEVLISMMRQMSGFEW